MACVLCGSVQCTVPTDSVGLWESSRVELTPPCVCLPQVAIAEYYFDVAHDVKQAERT